MRREESLLPTCWSCRARACSTAPKYKHDDLAYISDSAFTVNRLEYLS